MSPARIANAALLAAGALVVHNARYAIEYGADWRHALSEQGHGYLSLVVVLAVLGTLAAAWLAARDLSWAGRGRPVSRPAPSFTRAWLRASVLLAVLYAAQEIVGGMASSGHAAGHDGVLAGAGWTALVLAVAVGAAVAALACGARAAIALARDGLPSLAGILSPPILLARPRAGHGAGDAVALHLAGRGPPRTSA